MDLCKVVCQARVDAHLIASISLLILLYKNASPKHGYDAIENQNMTERKGYIKNRVMTNNAKTQETTKSLREAKAQDRHEGQISHSKGVLDAAAFDNLSANQLE